MQLYTEEECCWVLFGHAIHCDLPAYSPICPFSIQSSPQYNGFPIHYFPPGDMPFALYIPKRKIVQSLEVVFPPLQFYILIQRSTLHPWCYATAELFRPKKSGGPKAGDVVFEP